VGKDDNEAIAKQLAGKVVSLRIFSDESGKMNRSVLDLGAEILVVSQFTLYGETSKGTRPSFSGAASPDKAQHLYEEFTRQCQLAGAKVTTGVFRAHMKVHLINDGPVTLMCSVEPSESKICTELS
jgi:D-tyrosyl-tRNA(Tyr) deacylase